MNQNHIYTHTKNLTLNWLITVIQQGLPVTETMVLNDDSGLSVPGTHVGEVTLSVEVSEKHF